MAAGEILGLLAAGEPGGGGRRSSLVVAVRKIVRPRFGARLAYWLWLAPMLAAAAVLAPARRAVTVMAPLAGRATVGSMIPPFFEGLGAASSPPRRLAVAAPGQASDPAGPRRWCLAGVGVALRPWSWPTCNAALPRRRARAPSVRRWSA